jgi:hypothetical protein
MPYKVIFDNLDISNWRSLSASPQNTVYGEKGHVAQDRANGKLWVAGANGLTNWQEVLALGPGAVSYTHLTLPTM